MAYVVDDVVAAVGEICVHNIKVGFLEGRCLDFGSGPDDGFDGIAQLGAFRVGDTGSGNVGNRVVEARGLLRTGRGGARGKVGTVGVPSSSQKVGGNDRFTGTTAPGRSFVVGNGLDASRPGQGTVGVGAQLGRFSTKPLGTDFGLDFVGNVGKVTGLDGKVILCLNGQQRLVVVLDLNDADMDIHGLGDKTHVAHGKSLGFPNIRYQGGQSLGGTGAVLAGFRKGWSGLDAHLAPRRIKVITVNPRLWHTLHNRSLEAPKKGEIVVNPQPSVRRHFFQRQKGTIAVVLFAFHDPFKQSVTRHVLKMGQGLDSFGGRFAKIGLGRIELVALRIVPNGVVKGEGYLVDAGQFHEPFSPCFVGNVDRVPAIQPSPERTIAAGARSAGTDGEDGQGQARQDLVAVFLKRHVRYHVPLSVAQHLWHCQVQKECPKSQKNQEVGNGPAPPVAAVKGIVQPVHGQTLIGIKRYTTLVILDAINHFATPYFAIVGPRAFAVDPAAAIVRRRFPNDPSSSIVT